MQHSNTAFSPTFLLHRLSRSAQVEPPVPDPPRLPAEELQPLPPGVHLRDQAGHRGRGGAHEAMVGFLLVLSYLPVVIEIRAAGYCG